MKTYDERVGRKLIIICFILLCITIVLLIHGLFFKTYSMCTYDADTGMKLFCENTTSLTIQEKIKTLYISNREFSYLKLSTQFFAISFFALLAFLINKFLYNKMSIKTIRFIYLLPVIITLILCIPFIASGPLWLLLGTFVVFYRYRIIFFIELIFLIELYYRNHALKRKSQQ